MEKEQYYDAIIENPEFSEVPRWNGKVAWGYIYDDKKHRWPNGTEIRTSLVMEEFMDEDGEKYIKTMNTIYKVRKNG